MVLSICVCKYIKQSFSLKNVCVCVYDTLHKKLHTLSWLAESEGTEVLLFLTIKNGDKAEHWMESLLLGFHSVFNEIVHPIMKSLSSFTQVGPNLYGFLSSAEHKRWFFEECPSHSFQYNQICQVPTWYTIIININKIKK